MSEFEDRELAERLGRASGAFPDENAAYATVWRGVRRAKRRRALAAGTMAVAAIVAAGFVGVALRGGEGTSRLTTTPPTASSAEPSTTPATSTSTTTSSTTSTSSTTTSTSTTTTTAPSTLPPNDPPPTIDTTPVVVDTAPAAEATVRPTATTGRKRSTTTAPPFAAPDPTPPPETTPTATTPAAQITVQTFAGQGGTIDVRSDGTSLTILGTDPADQYSAEIADATGRRVEVRMSSRRHRTTIRVDLRSGQMVPTVTESDMGGGMDGGSGRRSDPPDSMP